MSDLTITLWAMLYEAAHIMLVRSTKWSWLKAWAMKIARQRGMKKAIVALARRLAVILHRVWVDGSEFRWNREGAASIHVAIRLNRLRMFARKNPSPAIRLRFDLIRI